MENTAGLISKLVVGRVSADERETGLDFSKVRDVDTFEMNEARAAEEAFMATSLRDQSGIMPADANSPAR